MCVCLFVCDECMCDVYESMMFVCMCVCVCVCVCVHIKESACAGTFIYMLTIMPKSMKMKLR